MVNLSAVNKSLEWLAKHNIKLPKSLYKKLREKNIEIPRALKQAETIEEANANYHDAVTASLIDYFEGGSISSSRSEFKQQMIEAFADSFDLGWVDGGQDLPIDDEDALSWLEARMNQEAGFIDGLFQEAKELNKEEDFDFLSWASSKADSYTGTLREIYNQAKLRAMEDIMVTFDGDDGEESCETCQSLKGKRHKISWFVKRNYVPPYGIGLQCARGGHCNHKLYDDKGNEVTA